MVSSPYRLLLFLLFLLLLLLLVDPARPRLVDLLTEAELEQYSPLRLEVVEVVVVGRGGGGREEEGLRSRTGGCL